MGRLLALSAAAAAWLCSASVGAQGSVEVLHYETLPSLRAGGDSTAKPSVRARLGFDAFGRRFDIALEPNVRLAAAARNLRLPADVVAYRGTLASSAAGWARIVTTPEGLAGLIWDGATLYGLEQRGDSLAAVDGTVIFRLDDVYVAPGTLGCAAHDSPVSGGRAYAALMTEMTPLAASGASLDLEVGAVADFEFHQAFGADAEEALLVRLNNVDGIFSQQLGVQITVAEVDVFTADGDPFTKSDAEALLEEVAVYRGATPAQDALGLTHLFTGRDLDGSTAGIAYLGVVCSTRNAFDPLGRSFGAGLSEGRRGSVLDSLVAAHEIGHNFGAPHDAQSGSDCEATPATFLMAPSINGVDQFSACSIEQMQPEIAAASCMTPIAAVDLSVALGDDATMARSGIAFDYAVDLGNLGIDVATEVGLDVAVESGLEVLAAEVASGACSIDALGASCALDDLPGGAARQLTLSLRGATPGQFAVTATATAAEDNAPGNDQAGGTVTIVPVVDLILSGVSTELELERSGVLEALLRNESDFLASGIALIADVSGGLQVDAATLAGAPCTVSGQTIDCAAGGLAARAEARLTLTVTGLSAGAERATLTVSAAEDEQNAADNSLLLAVQIVAPPREEQAGGGATSPLWLFIGLLALLRRRLRPLQ